MAVIAGLMLIVILNYINRKEEICPLLSQKYKLGDEWLVFIFMALRAIKMNAGHHKAIIDILFSLYTLVKNWVIKYVYTCIYNYIYNYTYIHV